MDTTFFFLFRLELVIRCPCLFAAVYKWKKYVRELLIHDRNCLIINQFSVILAFVILQMSTQGLGGNNAGCG